MGGRVQESLIALTPTINRVRKGRFNMTKKDASRTSVESVVHTPGPWAWEAHDPSMTTLGTTDGNGGVDLANEVLSVSRCKSCQKDPERRLCHMPNVANARLIAAAPELLEALQVLWKEVAESGNGWANDFGWRNAREKTLDALDKAL